MLFLALLFAVLLPRHVFLYIHAHYTQASHTAICPQNTCTATSSSTQLSQPNQIPVAAAARPSPVTAALLLLLLLLLRRMMMKMTIVNRVIHRARQILTAAVRVVAVMRVRASLRVCSRMRTSTAMTAARQQAATAATAALRVKVTVRRKRASKRALLAAPAGAIAIATKGLYCERV